MTDTDVAAVVAGLTKAQRAAVLAGVRVYLDPNTIRSLRKRGLVSRMDLTPLGIQCRDYLMRGEG